jgi:Sulfotransferase domain
MSLTRQPKVDFLIAGAQKSGTSALQRLLRQHPQIFMPKRKELHFFDKGDDDDWVSPDYSAYEKFFDNKRNALVAGEATPIYMYWPPCMARIRRYNPQIRLLICLRNPADRAFSHWAMERWRGRENLSFSDAIRSGRARLQDNDGPYPGYHRVFSYVERGYYGQQIGNILTYFPKGQILVVPHDDMHRDLDGLLGRICRFLGTRGFAARPVNETVVRAAPDPAVAQMSAVDRDYLLSVFRHDIGRTEKLTGLNLSAWLKEDAAGQLDQAAESPLG